MEDKTFELIEKMYAELILFKDNTNKRFDKLDDNVTEIKQRVINIENGHGKKLDALFDGHLQNSQQLERIEKEVSKHEDFILKRVK